MLLGLFLVIFSSQISHATIKTTDLEFTTSDGISISARHYAHGARATQQVVVIAPGYAQFKDTKLMLGLSAKLSTLSDVICFDFRGTGHSSDSFWFGAREYRDLEPILKWAKERYRKTVLIGFSLGAYSSVRAAYEYPKFVDQLLLVSVPTKVEDIVTTGGVFTNMWDVLTRSDLWGRQDPRNSFFHWGFPFLNKPDVSELAPSLTIPVAFLVGGRDHLVYEKLSRKIYDAVSGPKSWKKFQMGDHGEAMFDEFTGDFMNWFVNSAFQADLDSISFSSR